MGAIAEPAARSARAWLTHGATIVRVGAYISISVAPDRKLVACATKPSAPSPTTMCSWSAATAAFTTPFPPDVRKQGPWQAMRRGEIDLLKPKYRLALARYGYALVKCELSVFKPEV